MLGMAIEQDAVQSKPKLTFHPAFDTRHPGDIILRSDDDMSFYFRLARLAELSSFFATLPPPSDADLVDGLPVIPLHGATSLGLLMALKAVESTHSFEPFGYPESIQTEVEADQAVLSATLLARKYDLPIVIRVLQEAVLDDGPWIGQDGTYLTFAIWAIAGVESRIASAAEATIEEDEIPISCVSDTITQMCKAHAPRHWMQLQELHLRHSQAILRFRQELDDIPNRRASYHSRVLRCIEAEGRSKAVAAVRERLGGAETMEDVQALREVKYGLSCEFCQRGAASRYDELVERMEAYYSNYII